MKGRNLSVLANIRRYDGRATRETAAPPKQCGCGARAEHWRLLRNGTLRAFCASCWRSASAATSWTEAQVAAAVKLCDQLTAEIARLLVASGDAVTFDGRLGANQSAARGRAPRADNRGGASCEVRVVLRPARGRGREGVRI